MHPAASKKADVLIIGGGASGLAAACTVLEQGKTVLLLEARDRPGRKILATGNGRCNLMNAGAPLFFGDPGFANQVLQRVGQDDVRAFFERLGLIMVEEEGGLCYPASKQATSVLDVLLAPLEHNPRCRIVTDARVVGIEQNAKGFTVRTQSGETYAAKRLIAAAGGPAQPKLSGDDSLFPALQKLGHHVLPTRPALSALLTPKSAVQGLKGLRLPAICTLADGDRPVCRSEGEVLFADDGISGVCVMQLSRDAGELLDQGRKPVVYLDFAPLLNLAPRRMQRSEPGPIHEHLPAITAWLEDRASRLPSNQLLTGALPRLLQKRLEGKPLNQIAAQLSACPLPVTALRGFDHAQVAAGGIDCRDVDPATMRSRLHPNLSLCGELLNVDGDCGGHNLLFAWASGILAGKSVGENGE